MNREEIRQSLEKRINELKEDFQKHAELVEPILEGMIRGDKVNVFDIDRVIDLHIKSGEYIIAARLYASCFGNKAMMEQIAKVEEIAQKRYDDIVKLIS